MYPTYNFLTTALAVDISTMITHVSAHDFMAVGCRHVDQVHKHVHVSPHDFMA